MKKLLLTLVVILTALGMSACQTSEKQNASIVELETYDYYLLVVVSRERQSKDTFVYVLQVTNTTDNFTYESSELWSVGEFVIAIELDEEGNVYYIGLDATTDMVEDGENGEKYTRQIIDDFELVLELQQYYYQENITSHSFGDWLQINYPSLYQRIESYF